MVEIGGRVYLAKVFPGLPVEVFNERPKTHARFTSTESLIAVGEFSRGRLTEEIAFNSVDATVGHGELDMYCSLNGCRRR